MPLSCGICTVRYSNRSNLNRHIRTRHKIETRPESYDKGVWNFKCLEDNCNSSFQQNKGLIAHLEEIHNLKFESVTVSVEDMNEFLEWKSVVEDQNDCRYIYKAKFDSTNGEVISYYNCNRSGTVKSQRNENKEYKRGLKRQGTCKMKSSCTSQIKLTNKRDHLLIQWQKTHYGHETELEHIRLPQEHRKIIASKLVCGVPPAKILEMTRKNIGNKPRRLDLLTSRDIRNIKRSFKIKHGYRKRPAKGGTTPDLCKEECSSEMEEQTLVLFDQNKGELSDDSQIEKNEEFEITSEEDFYTSIKNESQKVLSCYNKYEQLQDIINSTFFKLQQVDLNSLDDDVTQQIHRHLEIVNSLTKSPQSIRNEQ